MFDTASNVLLLKKEVSDLVKFNTFEKRSQNLYEW